MDPHFMAPCSPTTIHLIDAKFDPSFLQYESYRTRGSKTKSNRGVYLFFALENYDRVIDGNGRQMAINKYAGQIWGLEPGLIYP